MELEPESRQLLLEIEPQLAAKRAALAQRSIAQMRAASRAKDSTNVLDTTVRRTDHRARVGKSELSYRLYEPRRAESERWVLYLHGGGWVSGDLSSNDDLCTRLAEQSGVNILSLGYRLAPEDPFPAALNDTIAALRGDVDEVNSRWPSVAFESAVGASAGANLLAAACLALRDEGETAFLPALQVLLYPPLDPTLCTPSANAAAYGYGLELEQMRWYWDLYLGYEEPSAYFAPLRATSLVGVPPALIWTAECDPLRDDGHRYAMALKRSGVPCMYRCARGTVHGFVGNCAVLQIARDAVSQISSMIREPTLSRVFDQGAQA